MHFFKFVNFNLAHKCSCQTHKSCVSDSKFLGYWWFKVLIILKCMHDPQACLFDGKSWKNHGIVFLNFCGNAVLWTGGDVLIMQIIYFWLSHKNCGCYGNGNSQNVALVGDMCAGNTCACFHFDLLCSMWLLIGLLQFWSYSVLHQKKNQGCEAKGQDSESQPLVKQDDYCPTSQEWQWLHVLFTKLSGTYNW